MTASDPGKPSETEFEAQIQAYSKEELISVLRGLDREAFPGRYDLAIERYRKITNDPTFDMSDPTERYHTGWRRFFALILDIIFLSIAGYLLMLPFNLLGLHRFFGFFDPEFILNALYPVLAIWLYGKTLGKKLCGLEVRSWPDEGPVVLSASIMREIVPIALAVLSPLLTLLPEDNGRGIWPFISLAAGFLVVIAYAGWLLLEIVTMLLDPQRRAFHDKIAGTVVIKTD